MIEWSESFVHAILHLRPLGFSLVNQVLLSYSPTLDSLVTRSCSVMEWGRRECKECTIPARTNEMDRQ
jgi:hypothetical protein